MNILIIRTEGPKIPIDTYNVPEIELAKAFVRAGHQADVVLYGGMDDDRTQLVPVNDTGVVIYDEKLLGDDAYVREGDIDTEDPDRFISVYYLSSLKAMGGCIFFSLGSMVSGYDRLMVRGYDRFTSWLYYSDRKWRDKAVIYQEAYEYGANRGYGRKCAVFDKTFLKIRNMPNTLCMAVSDKAAEFLKSKGFENVHTVGYGLDTDTLDETIEADEAGAGSGSAGTEFGRALKKAGADRAGEFFTFLFAGRLGTESNVKFALDLADRMLTAHEDVRFVFIGDGDRIYKSECLSRMRKWMDRGRITYASSVRMSEIPSVYRMTDCVIHPDIYDPAGRMIYEAVYFGVPVITGNTAGADILIRNEINGIVPEDMTLVSWTNAAEKIYSDVNLRNRLKVALLDDRDRLKWDNVAARMLKAMPGKDRKQK